MLSCACACYSAAHAPPGAPPIGDRQRDRQRLNPTGRGCVQDALAADGIVPSPTALYDLRDILAAFKKGLGTAPQLVCSGGELNEVRAVQHGPPLLATHVPTHNRWGIALRGGMLLRCPRVACHPSRPSCRRHRMWCRLAARVVYAGGSARACSTALAEQRSAAVRSTPAPAATSCHIAGARACVHACTRARGAPSRGPGSVASSSRRSSSPAIHHRGFIRTSTSSGSSSRRAT
jgi:hypothetical protein